MKNKKSAEKDLSRKSTLFFQVGLILVLLLVWQVIEWKTVPATPPEVSVMQLEDFDDFTIPVTRVKEAVPPEPVQKMNDEVQVIENDQNVVESFIAPTDIEEPAIDITEIEVADEEGPEEIEDFPFRLVEEVPVFPGCENLLNNQARKECMTEQIAQYVHQKFDTSLGGELGLQGVNRIYVTFRIEPSGEVSVLHVRGPHPILEKEADRVIRSLPQMQPGKQRGKPVGVIYSLPIIFQVQN